MIETLSEQLLRHWAETDVNFRPGLTDAEIDAWEVRRSVRLPAELRALYRATNGMAEGSVDANLLYFWPLDELEDLDSESFRPVGLPEWHRWYVFADLFSDAYHLAVFLGANEDRARVVWVCGSEYVDVARTFPQVLEAYLRDPEAVVRY